MPRVSYAIFLGLPGQAKITSLGRGARLAARQVSCPEGSAPEDFVRDVSSELADLGYLGEPLLLALPASACLTASLETQNLPARGRRQTLLYLLEEKLPVSAEDVATDFQVGEEHTLAIATELAPLRELLGRLERSGVSVELITPASLLAMPRGAARGLSVFEEGDSLEVLLTSGPALRAWRRVPRNGAALLAALEPYPEWLEGKTQVTYAPDGEGSENLGPEKLGLSELLPEAEVKSISPEDKELAELQMASDVLSGRKKPLFNFRRGELAEGRPFARVKRELALLCVSFLIFLAALGGSLLFRSREYQALSGAGRTALHAEFRKVFPRQNIPVSVSRRLESRLKELEGLSAQGAGIHGPERRPSALTRLHACLSLLPRELRYRLLDVRVLPTKIHLRGHARSHSAANLISKSLEPLASFEVEAPATQNLSERGVSFSISLREVGGTGS